MSDNPQIIVQGDFYNQNGNFGIGHNKGEIKFFSEGEREIYFGIYYFKSILNGDRQTKHSTYN